MLKLYGEVIKGEYAVAGAVPNYVTGLTLLGSSSGRPLCLPVGTLACDESYKDPQLAPLGIVPADQFDSLFNAWRELPKDPALAWANTGFLYADMVGAQRFDYHTVDGVEKIRWSSFGYTYRFPFVEGRNNENVFIDALHHTKDAIAASPIKDYVVSHGPILVFWEVFLDLGSRLSSLIAVGCLIIFVVTLLLSSFDIPVAIITSVSCALIVTQVYGIASYFMNFNIFVAALVLFGLGMAVEFTAHFAMAFNSQTGNDDHTERLGLAMAHTFPAVLEGSFSTLVSIIPLAFASNMFTVKYMFGVIALVVVIGLVNGLFIMPGLMALLSPAIRALEARCGRKKAVRKDIESGDANQHLAQTPTPAAPLPSIQEGNAAPPGETEAEPAADDTDKDPVATATPAAPPKETAAGASSSPAWASDFEKKEAASEQEVGVVKQVE